jgi:biopolymer transport protein ExbD
MPLKTHQDEMPSINLTPMIDIVFQLIIFFMVGTKFSEIEKTIDLKLPQVSSTAPISSAPQKRVINLFRDGKIQMNQQEMSIGQLKSELTTAREQYSELGVVVRGDAQTDLQNVAAVLTACREAGISDLGISVRIGTKER